MSGNENWHKVHLELEEKAHIATKDRLAELKRERDEARALYEASQRELAKARDKLADPAPALAKGGEQEKRIKREERRALGWRERFHELEAQVDPTLERITELEHELGEEKHVVIALTIAARVAAMASGGASEEVDEIITEARRLYGSMREAADGKA